MSEYWEEFAATGGDLVFIKPQDGGGGAVFLSRQDTPEIANDRDRALLRAYLTLALERLDRQEMDRALGVTSRPVGVSDA